MKTTTKSVYSVIEKSSKIYLIDIKAHFGLLFDPETSDIDDLHDKIGCLRQMLKYFVDNAFINKHNDDRGVWYEINQKF